MKNAQWLYDQIPGPDDEDEGVQLSSAHALQIAGELTEISSKLVSLENAVRAAAEAVATMEGVSIGYYMRQVEADPAAIAVINALDPTEAAT